MFKKSCLKDKKITYLDKKKSKNMQTFYYLNIQFRQISYKKIFIEKK